MTYFQYWKRKCIQMLFSSPQLYMKWLRTINILNANIYPLQMVNMLVLPRYGYICAQGRLYWPSVFQKKQGEAKDETHFWHSQTSIIPFLKFIYCFNPNRKYMIKGTWYISSTIISLQTRNNTHVMVFCFIIITGMHAKIISLISIEMPLLDVVYLWFPKRHIALWLNH